jgi:hypothetical protein
VVGFEKRVPGLAGEFSVEQVLGKNPTRPLVADTPHKSAKTFDLVGVVQCCKYVTLAKDTNRFVDPMIGDSLGKSNS